MHVLQIFFKGYDNVINKMIEEGFEPTKLIALDPKSSPFSKLDTLSSLIHAGIEPTKPMMRRRLLKPLTFPVVLCIL